MRASIHSLVFAAALPVAAGQTYTVSSVCNPVRYVRVNFMGNVNLNFGELQVLQGDTNAALGGVASQSSVYGEGSISYCGGAEPTGLHPASFAIDGNLCTFADTGGEANPWWTLDLGAALTEVTSVVFYNRNDGYHAFSEFASRAFGATISLLDANNILVSQHTLPSANVLTYIITCTDAVSTTSASVSASPSPSASPSQSQSSTMSASARPSLRQCLKLLAPVLVQAKPHRCPQVTRNTRQLHLRGYPATLSRIVAQLLAEVGFAALSMLLA